MQTNVKLSPNSLTTPTHPPPTYHPSLGQLLLLEFQKKFVPLPTMQKVGFIATRIPLHVHFYCFTNISIIMGKVTSLYGKTMGKIGSIVFSTSGGQTIAREYNPHVANPNTIAQVNQRARMKLMSQLSACLSTSIVMQKEGLVSRRNKFTKRNMPACYASNGTAQITYENVQLTEGSLGLPQITAEFSVDADTGQENLNISLASSAAINVARVVYNIYQKTDEGKLQLLYSAISESASQSGSVFAISIPASPFKNKELVIYAYGMVDTSERATANFGNLNVQNGSDLATLVASRTLSYEDYQFTQTRGATLGTNGSPITPTPSGEARVFVTALGQGGTVSGGGTFTIGTQVTVTATPNQGFYFKGWANNGSAQIISTSASYTFTLQGQTDLVAMFDIDTI